VNTVAFYLLLLLFCGAAAWFVSGFASVKRLDDRLFALLRRAKGLLTWRVTAIR
jgi:hypothetical protein